MSLANGHPRKRPGAQPHGESLSVGLGWLHATSSLPNTAHHPSPQTNIKANNGGNKSSIFRTLTLSSTPLRPRPPLQPIKRVCVSADRPACSLLHRPPALVPFPCASTLIKRHFISNLTCDPHTPPSVAHTLPTHPIHPRLPPPPCRGSSPRVRRRQCRPDLPTPRGLSPTSTP